MIHDVCDQKAWWSRKTAVLKAAKCRWKWGEDFGKTNMKRGDEKMAGHTIYGN